MKIPILLYHSVNVKPSPHFQRWMISPKLFDEHMACLRELDYTPVSLEEAVRAINHPAYQLPERAVVITFDDGFEDFYRFAWPILAKHQIPSTIYIVAGYIGGTSAWLDAQGEGSRRMMNWEQLKEIAAGGVEIGAHTLHHYHLDTMKREAAYREIAGSKEVLEQKLGLAVRSFAYPHGYHSKEIKTLVKQAGFTSACAVKHGLSSTEDNPFSLARIIVSGNTRPESLGDLLQGLGLYPVSDEERLRTKVWRIVRRAIFRLRGVEIPAALAQGGDPIYGNPTDPH